jgi:hypothetical protein
MVRSYNIPDACAIENKYHGVIVGTIALDGERGMVPLVFAIRPIESTEIEAGFRFN